MDYRFFFNIVIILLTFTLGFSIMACNLERIPSDYRWQLQSSTMIPSNGRMLYVDVVADTVTGKCYALFDEGSVIEVPCSTPHDDTPPDTDSDTDGRGDLLPQVEQGDTERQC